MKKIGVLAFHGDVAEHIEATKQAAMALRLNIEVISVRTKNSLHNLNALIIPGGESTTLHKLCRRENMWADMKKVKNIFGTCAGAIMLAKTVHHKTTDQETLELMDMEIDRNAYGRQTESFEKDIKTSLGRIRAVFIRAPRIKSIGKKVLVLARMDKEVAACEETVNGNYYLATCFHPELSSSLFHKHFLQKIIVKN